MKRGPPPWAVVIGMLLPEWTQDGWEEVMGLDTTHGCWHGPYSSFSAWRNAVADAAGYWVAPMTYGDGVSRKTIIIDWGHLGTEDHLMGMWDEVPADPLLILFVHHDHDGVIPPEHASLLADALEEVEPKMKVDPEMDWMRRATRNFIDGLRKAAAAGETVEFR